MVERWWLRLPSRFPLVQTDAFQIMPNHLHGVLFIHSDPANNVGAAPSGRPGRPHEDAPTLGRIVGWLKTMTTNEYIRNVRDDGWLSFQERLWQRGYYEHIVRNEDDLHDIREYVVFNPLKWSLDKENPKSRLVEQRT
jgi:REP element-mobilizing transposase RayT